MGGWAEAVGEAESGWAPSAGPSFPRKLRASNGRERVTGSWGGSTALPGHLAQQGRGLAQDQTRDLEP